MEDEGITPLYHHPSEVILISTELLGVSACMTGANCSLVLAVVSYYAIHISMYRIF